jgi:LacI family transcriptional regulator
MRLGVSEATVSRVMNNSPNVAPAMRKRVLDDYVDLYNSVPLATQSMVGMIVPDFSNPFFAQLAFTFERALEESNQHLLVSSSEGRYERELLLLQRFRSIGVQGVIFISSGDSSESLQSLVADGEPVLVLDRRLVAGNVDFVTTNSRKATLAAVDYLRNKGHSRVGYLRGLPGTETARERFASFQTAMKQAGLELSSNWTFKGDYTEGSGVDCAEKLVAMRKADRPTALLAGNDLMAIGLMQRLQQEQWVLPKELSVIGFDDISFSRWSSPALTTIAQPIEKLVLESIRLLTRRMRAMSEPGRPRPNPEEVQIEPTLVHRKSVAQAKL